MVFQVTVTSMEAGMGRTNEQNKMAGAASQAEPQLQQQCLHFYGWQQPPCLQAQAGVFQRPVPRGSSSSQEMGTQPREAGLSLSLSSPRMKPPPGSQECHVAQE